VLRRSLIAAVAATAMAPAVGRAQAPAPAQQTPSAGVLTLPSGMLAAAIPDPNAALLQPSLLGNPAKPLQFRRPGDVAQDQAPTTGQFTTPSRIGATPVYGSPAGFGAGDTGFDSSNTPKNKKKALKAKAPPPPGPGVIAPETTFDPLATTQFTTPAAPTTMQPLAAPAPAQPPAPQVYPAKAAARPGAVLPPLAQPVPIDNVPPEVYPLAAAHRAGATVPVPQPIDADASVATPPPGTQPISTFRLAPARSGCCRSAMAMPIRRSASAAVRSYSSRRLNCRRPMPAIRKPYRKAEVRRISWWLRNCWCNPTGRATRSPPASPAPTPITPTAASCRRSIVPT